ncbi:hypothetical protein KSS87_012032, partial [Heliosperma pusillum]
MSRPFQKVPLLEVFHRSSINRGEGLHLPTILPHTQSIVSKPCNPP